MPTLRELIAEFNANAFVITDKGNGTGYDQDGHSVRIDDEYGDDAISDYGDVEMFKLAAPHKSADGVDCNYASEYVDRSDLNDGYQVKIYF